MHRSLALVLVVASLANTTAYAKRRAAKSAELDEDDGDGPEAKAAVAITLADLIDVAVRQSPELARPKAAMDEAKGNEAAAHAPWRLTLGAEYARNGITDDLVTPGVTVVDQEELTTTIGVAKTLGATRVSVEAFGKTGTKEFALDPSQLATNPETVDQSQVGATVGIVQKLLRDGPSVASAPLRRAQLQRAKATVETQLAAEKLLQDIVSGYWELAYNAFEVDVRAEALAIAKEQEDMVRKQIRAQTMPLNKLDAVTVEVMRRTRAQLVAQTAYEKRSLELRRRTGLGLQHRDVVLRPDAKLELVKGNWDTQDTIERARTRSFRLASLVLDKRIAALDLEVADNARLPDVEVTAKAGLAGSARKTVGEALDGIEGGFTVTLGVKGSFDFGRAGKGRYDAARARKARVEVERLDAERTLETDVARAVAAVKSARLGVELADKEIQAAENNARAARAQFQGDPKGGDYFAVTSRLTELVDARLGRARAVVDFWVALTELRALAGDLLEEYGVSVRARVDS